MRDTLLDGKFRNHDATIILATNAKVRRLNWRYASNRETTDVLSFALRDEPRRTSRSLSVSQKDIHGLIQDAPFLDPNTGQLRSDIHAPRITNDLGRIFVAVPFCKTIAKERSMEHADYITLACAHGMAHLVGFDHETEDEIEIMKRAEEEVVQAVISEVGIVGDVKSFPKSYLS